MSAMQTRLTETYGLAHPVASAAMAFATLSPRLPVAVGNAGAFAAFAAGPLPIPFIRENLIAIREQTAGPVNLNFIVNFATDEHINLALELGPRVVSFHWQLPPNEWIWKLHEAGIDVWQQVGTVRDAQAARDLGVDLVIAQGAEAGGHCYGRHPLQELLPAVLGAVAKDVLVLGAGGIADGPAVADVLRLGADGAMVGTALLATPEADVADEYKQAIVNAGDDDTVLSSMFGRDMPDFNPMRLIRNKLVNEWHDRVAEVDALLAHEQPVIGSMELVGRRLEMRRFSSLLPVQGATGDFSQMPLTAGRGSGAIHRVEPAGAVVERLARDAEQILEAMPAV
jgi:enoyl-[acyl-carrier protein] reductase II